MRPPVRSLSGQYRNVCVSLQSGWEGLDALRGLLISIYPFIKAWLNINHILPSFGNFRVHPAAVIPAPEQVIETIRRDGTQSQLNLERCKSRMGTFVDGGPVAETNPDEGPLGAEKSDFQK
ncbi:hypothetical protein JOB18_037886 [Solea senegalensis]|nr:hypothetical protein JOB18_037886 [Solea senegalensis]